MADLDLLPGYEWFSRVVPVVFCEVKAAARCVIGRNKRCKGRKRAQATRLPRAKWQRRRAALRGARHRAPRAPRRARRHGGQPARSRARGINQCSERRTYKRAGMARNAGSCKKCFEPGGTHTRQPQRCRTVRTRALYICARAMRSSINTAVYSGTGSAYVICTRNALVAGGSKCR